LGQLWEAAVTLKFEPDRIAYDPDESLMRFFATEGAAVIPCRISIAALAELEDSAFGVPNSIVDSYLRHHELIQDIAERKYRAHRFETGGRVIVRLQDLTA
jgi:hypothetical protein